MPEITPASALAVHAEEIRKLGRRVVGDVIEIGRRLTEAKKLCGHGNWLPWLKREFGWSENTALRFMRAHELSSSLKSAKLADLEIPVSGLYLLAAPSTPPEVVDAVIERAKAGEHPKHAEIVQAIAEMRSGLVYAGKGKKFANFSELERVLDRAEGDAAVEEERNALRSFAHGDGPEPEFSDEKKAKYERAWTLLTAEEQDLLAIWRKKYLGENKPAEDPCDQARHLLEASHLLELMDDQTRQRLFAFIKSKYQQPDELERLQARIDVLEAERNDAINRLADAEALPKAAQRKLETLEQQLKKHYDKIFEETVHNEIRRRVQEMVEPRFAERERDAERCRKASRQRGVFEREEYNVILRCVHPDRTPTVDEKNEAFRLLHENRILLLSEEDDPRTYPPIPTADEILAGIKKGGKRAAAKKAEEVRAAEQAIAAAKRRMRE
jgi:hypothetical protein